LFLSDIRLKKQNVFIDKTNNYISVKKLEVKVEEEIEINLGKFAAVAHELISDAIRDMKTASDAAAIRDSYVKIFSEGVKNYGELVNLANKIFGKYYPSFREAIAC